VNSDPTDPLHVLVIGAGLSGVCLGYHLRRAAITDFRIVEAAESVGGTWHHNTYPGLVCDVPSHLYCYSFRPNPDWSHVYSPGPEIRQYVETCVDEFGLRDDIVLSCRVDRLDFDEESGRWRVSFADGSGLVARHVIRATGGLHVPKWPDIPGRDDFGGHVMHTARWNHDLDLDGLRIGVIGNGASSVQVVPQLAERAARLTVFQRTPSWILPRDESAFSDDDRQGFRDHPETLSALREELYHYRHEVLHPLFGTDRTGDEFQEIGRAMALEHLENSIPDPELRAELTPDYPLGCKRLLISSDFYPTLVKDHVALVTEPLERFCAEGLVTVDGTVHELDVIVCATGYDLDAHTASIDIVGRGGELLADRWIDRPEAYRQVTVPGYPNLFWVGGPNSGSGYLSMTSTMEPDCEYVVRCIELAREDSLLEVRQDACDQYNDTLQARLTETVWAGDCRSWYKRPDGRITTLYPGTADEYAADKAEVVLDHYTLTPVP
jgi:cation diffusion facilitator CzcD-associated flavoprotein CzcO